MMKPHWLGQALLAATLLLSCSDAPTSTTNFWNRFNTAIYLEAGRTTYTLGTLIESSDEATATFHNSDSLGLYAGSVTFEGTPLQLHDSTFLTSAGAFIGWGYTAVSGFNPLPLRMNGSLNTFVSTGGPNAPAMTVKAASPLREMAVVNPLDGDSVVADNGVTIRWEPSLAEGSAVDIRLYSLSPDAPFNARLRYPVVADNGSYQVNGFELDPFPAGPLVVSVRRFVRTTGVLADERQYDARIYSEQVVLVDLRR